MRRSGLCESGRGSGWIAIICGSVVGGARIDMTSTQSLAQTAVLMKIGLATHDSEYVKTVQKSGVIPSHCRRGFGLCDPVDPYGRTALLRRCRWGREQHGQYSQKTEPFQGMNAHFCTSMPKSSHGTEFAEWIGLEPDGSHLCLQIIKCIYITMYNNIRRRPLLLLRPHHTPRRHLRPAIRQAQGSNGDQTPRARHHGNQQSRSHSSPYEHEPLP